MVYRLMMLFVSFYFILTSIAGSVVHCVMSASCPVSPSILQTVVYFAVFGCIGLPLVTGTFMWQSRWHDDF